MSDVSGSYPERLEQLELTTLEKRRRRGDAIEVFIEVFMPLTVPRANLDLRKNFFSIRGAKLWNSLPSAGREANSVNHSLNMRTLRVISEMEYETFLCFNELFPLFLCGPVHLFFVSLKQILFRQTFSSVQANVFKLPLSVTWIAHTNKWSHEFLKANGELT